MGRGRTKTAHLATSKLGIYILKKRIEARLTQRELAAVMGESHPQFISNIERGRCLLPAKWIKLVAAALDVDYRTIVRLIAVDRMNQLWNEVEAA